VMTLARTLYDGADLTIRVADPDRLDVEIMQALERPAVADPATHEHNLGYMVDAEFETTFLMTPEGTDEAVEHLGRTIADVSGSRAPLAAAAGS